MIYRASLYLWVMAIGMYLCGTIWSQLGEMAAGYASSGVMCVAALLMTISRFVDE